MMNNEQIVEALKESGMRITRQRMIVADIIADNDGANCKDIPAWCFWPYGKLLRDQSMSKASGL